MNKAWDLILELESDNGKLFKQNLIEREALAKNTEFFEGLRYCLHPLTTFGVKQIPESTVASIDAQLLSHTEFVDLCEELSDRNLTGHAARDAIHDIMLKCGQSQWDNWFRRILMQDIKAGFSESTVNKAVAKAKTPQYNIPVFECQLAVDSEKRPNDMNGKKQVDIKLDGVRVLSICPASANKEVKQTSRNGREMNNFPTIREQLEGFKEFFTEDMVIDAEVMSGSFQDLMKQVQRQSNVETDDAVLHIFDILPLSEFLAGGSKLTQTERNTFLNDYVEENFSDFFHLKFPNLSIVSSEIVDLDTAEGHARLMEINALALDGGYEGIMLKDVDSKYQCKRTPDWLKLKPFIEVDLEIVSLYPGKPETKNEHRLGGFNMKGTFALPKRIAEEHGMKEGDIVTVEVACGGGFSDKQRDEFWDEVVGGGTKLHGHIGEVRGDCVTKSDNKDTWSIRFPRFRRFRDFEAGVKV